MEICSPASAPSVLCKEPTTESILTLLSISFAYNYLYEITHMCGSVEKFHCAEEVFKLSVCRSSHSTLKAFIANILVLNNPYLLFAITPRQVVDPYNIIGNILDINNTCLHVKCPLCIFCNITLKASIANILVLNYT